jgi:hypothetical protein
MDIPLKHLRCDVDPHGNERFYASKNRRSIRLREAPGSPGFLEYRAALTSLEGPTAAPKKARQVRTLEWLADEGHWRRVDGLRDSA